MHALGDWTEFLAAAAPLRPRLHQYCVRLLGSVIDAEDIVQDTLIKAYTAANLPQEKSQWQPWLFKIAHNRSIDFLRAHRARNHYVLSEQDEMLIELGQDLPAAAEEDPLEQLTQQETLRVSLAVFLCLPIYQRSVVILKDVLGESLAEIAQLLDLTQDAVKAHLARGRKNLLARRGRSFNHNPSPGHSPQLTHYVALFNQRDWEALRQLLSSEVQLQQSSHPVRKGAADVGTFFTIYARCDFGRLEAAWLDGREVILVYPPEATTPLYLMWLEWQANRIVFIRDYRYVDYLLAELPLIELVRANY